MKIKLLSLVSILFLAASIQSAVAAAESDMSRLDPNVAPTYQQLTLNIDPRETDYSGSTVIDLVIANATDQIRLHALEIDITISVKTRYI